MFQLAPQAYLPQDSSPRLVLSLPGRRSVAQVRHHSAARVRHRLAAQVRHRPDYPSCSNPELETSYP